MPCVPNNNTRCYNKTGRKRSLGAQNVPFSPIKEHLPMLLKIEFVLLTKSQYSHGMVHYLLFGFSRTGLKDGLTQNHVHTFINWQCHSRRKDTSFYFTYIVFNRNKDMMMVIRYIMMMTMMVMMMMMMMMMIKKQDTCSHRYYIIALKGKYLIIWEQFMKI